LFHNSIKECLTLTKEKEKEKKNRKKRVPSGFEPQASKQITLPTN
jgi:hypothetical protein